MIELTNLTKSFDDILAVDHVSVSIREKEVFGLIGTNGAGKSTLLRMLAGIIKPDFGTVVIDDMPVYDNVIIKQRMFFIADEPYFFSNSTASDMEEYYSSVYPSFNKEQFEKLLADFGLDSKRKINTFSKGMKKQLAILLGICAGTKYLLCDETFDGLDPVMRQSVKSLMGKEMEERGLTPIIASHNLRELEDICDHVGLLHKGGVLLSKDLDDMKLGIQKVQYVPADKDSGCELLQKLTILNDEKRGSLHVLTVRNNREEVMEVFNNMNVIFFETLPLSLEEIFISETEVAGYDVRKLILD